MADDIKIVVGVDDSDVLSTIKNHQILEKRVAELNKEYARLDKAFNSGQLSAQAYSKAVNQVDGQVAHLQSTMRKGGSAVRDLATGMNFSGKAARRNEVAFQQAGYQIQDFIVQVQGGTNPLIAFSQQGSQLAGFFAGPWGASIGLGIAALSSLAMAFFSTEKEAKQLEKSLKEIKDGLDDFQSKAEEAEETVSSFAYAMAQVQKTQIEAAWASLGESTAGAFEASFLAKLGRSLKLSLAGEIDSWSKASGSLAGENFAAAFGDGAKGILDQALLDQIGKAVKDKNLDILDSTIQQLSAFTGMTETGAQFLEYLIRMRDEANGFTEEVKDAASKIESASNDASKLAKLDLAMGIGEAAKVAELLAERMGITLKAARALVGVAGGAVMGGRGQDPRQFTYMDEFRKQLADQDSWEPPETKKTGGASKPTVEKYLRQLQEEAKYKRSLVGLSEEEQRVQEIIYNAKKQELVVTEAQAKSVAELEEGTRKLIEAEDKRKAMMDMIEGNIEDAFMTMIDGSASVEDAFKGMLRNILLEIYRQQVAKPIGDLIGSFLEQANGGAWNKGVQMFADGGVVSAPTAFRHSGGLGVMGEAGPEAIMPLKRGKNGKLGVQMEGSQQPVVINQSFNFSANGDDSVKRIIAQAAPSIANMAKQSVIDARRRGGVMKNTFG